MAPVVLAASFAALAIAQLGGAAVPPPGASLQVPVAGPTPEERWWVRIGLGMRGGLFEYERAPSVGLGYDLRADVGRLSAAATIEAAFGERSEVLAIGGAGVSRPIGTSLAGHVLLVGGTDWFHVREPDGPGWQDHLFPAAGVRAGVRRVMGIGRVLAFGVVEATVLHDLGTERDAFRGRVGGWIVSISVSGGLGLGFGRRGALRDRPADGGGAAAGAPERQGIVQPGSSISPAR